jgi:tetratricopeptide (TPR) repeat protein
VSLAAAVLLAALAAPAPGQAALVEALRHAEAAERRAAAERLGEVGDQAAAGDLARALRDADPGVRAAAADALWAIWHRSGDPEIDALLREGIAHLDARRLAEAVATFTEVIRRAPAFAEGWNKRATAYYLQGDYDRSLADCREVVRRNPLHFGALSGAGLNHLRKEELEGAAEWFARALQVNPNLPGIAALLDQIREELARRRRPAI